MLASLLLAAIQAPGATIDVHDLLAEWADRASAARFPAPAYRLRSSDWDRRAPAGADGLFDLAAANGPGAIVRIVAADADARVRIALDGADEPVIDARLADLPVDVAPSAAVLDLPIPFARSARVACSDAGARVVWRSYGDDVRLVPFTRDDLADASRARARAFAAWERTAADAGEETFRFHLSEAEPEGLLLANAGLDARGPRAITEIRLQIDAREPERALATTRLRLAFDGRETVAATLGELAGVFDELRPHHDAFRTVTTTGIVVLRFVMPYRESFGMRVENAGDPQLHLSGSVRTISWTWDARSLHFHATPDSSDGLAPAWKLRGRGVLVGESLAQASWSGQPVPDRALRADGASLGVVRGAGGSERIEHAARLAPRHAGLLAGLPRADGPGALGRVDAYRFLRLDAVPFERELDLGPRDAVPAPATFARHTVLLWYGAPDAHAESAGSQRPLPILSFPRVPDAIEAESAPLLEARDVRIDLAPETGSAGTSLALWFLREAGRAEIEVASEPGRRRIRVHADLDGLAATFTVDGARAAAELLPRSEDIRTVGDMRVYDLGEHAVGTTFRFGVLLDRVPTPARPVRIDAITAR